MLSSIRHLRDRQAQNGNGESSRARALSGLIMLGGKVLQTLPQARLPLDFAHPFRYTVLIVNHLSGLKNQESK
jgi:hypothetical protein